jgi:hypothetical protein
MSRNSYLFRNLEAVILDIVGHQIISALFLFEEWRLLEYYAL